MKRTKLSVPQNYVSNLERLLGLELSHEALITKKGRKALEPFVQGVSALSSGLTKEKNELIQRKYLREDDIRNAYLLYYTTTNFLKVIQPIGEWLPYFGGDTLRILDLGCGTGAATWGVLHYLSTHEHSIKKVEITFADHIKENLDICKKLFALQEVGVEITADYHQIDIKDDKVVKKVFGEGKYDLVIMMNTLNELPEDGDTERINTFTALLSDDGALLIIEPASKRESRRLLSLRETALWKKLTVYSPCTHQQNCPAIIKADDWCFNEVGWERPEFIRHIDDEVGNVRLSLKYSYVILTKNGTTLHGNLGLSGASRIVSEVFAEKGRTRAVLCDENGRGEHVLNKRDKSLNNKVLIDAERFDLVTLKDTEKREHDTRILESSSISIVLPILGA